MMTTLQQTIETLENIETLAIMGVIPGTLTALTARLLTVEVSNSNNIEETLERAATFIRQCEQNTKG